MRTSYKLTLKISLFVAIMSGAFSKGWKEKPFYEDCKYGDVLVVGLFSLHRKTADDECATLLNIQEFANAQAMVYAINQVNMSPYLLPNITLGYRIFDTCGIPSRANAMAFSLVTDNTPTERGDVSNATTPDEQVFSSCLVNVSTRPIAAVIGPSDSASSVVVASMLQAGNTALISPSATSDELSLPYYETFFRTVPPDSQQAVAISDVINYFNWTYIWVIGSDSSYGRYGVRAVEHVAHERNTFCIHSIDYIPSANYENKIQRIVTRLKKATTVKVILLWTGGISTLHYFFQECYKQKLFDRTWIAPDGWSEATSVLTSLYSLEYSAVIGTTFRRFNASGFEEDFVSINASSPRFQNEWSKEFWQQVNNCSQFPWKGCGDQLTRINEDLFSIMHSTTSAYVIDAVQAAAHAIDAVYRCQQGPYNLSKTTCPFSNALADNVLRFLRNVQFQGLTGDISFNENGDSLRSAAYDIVNYQLVPGETPILKQVGTWGRFNEQRLQLKRELLLWNNGSKVVPSSRCSESCPPGTRQSAIMNCCWECIPCRSGSVSTSYSSTNCTACLADEKPNQGNTACEPLPLNNLSPDDPRGIGLLVAAAIGVILTLLTFGVFVKYRTTPVVKSSNQELSYVFLLNIFVAFLAACFLIFKPTPFLCTVYMFVVPICVNISLSILFLKTARLLHVFDFQGAVSSKSCWIYNRKYQFIALGSLNILPVVFIIVLLFFEPPSVHVIIVPLHHKTITCEHNESIVGEIIHVTIYAYELFLSLMVTCYAFRARKLPSNFKETKYIAFTMYIQLITWGLVIAIFTSLKTERTRTFLNCCAQLCSAFSFLLCNFAPKLFIILLHSEKNTPEFVKAALTRDTMAKMMSNTFHRSRRTVSEPPPLPLERNGKPTLVKDVNLNESNGKRAPRRFTWDSPTTIRDQMTHRDVVELHMRNGISPTHVNSASSESCGKGILVESGDRNTGNDGECAFHNTAMAMDKLEDPVILRNEDYKSVVEDTSL